MRNFLFEMSKLLEKKINNNLFFGKSFFLISKITILISYFIKKHIYSIYLIIFLYNISYVLFELLKNKDRSDLLIFSIVTSLLMLWSYKNYAVKKGKFYKNQIYQENQELKKEINENLRRIEMQKQKDKTLKDLDLI